jgi:hypothetical protein
MQVQRSGVTNERIFLKITVLHMWDLAFLDTSKTKRKCVGFEFLMAVSTKMVVFWVVAPCSVVEVHQFKEVP